MKTEQSVSLLNQALADELAAVHQYMYFHFHLDDQGFKPLSDLFKRTAIIEMGHVERLAERILFLGGDVDMKPNSAVAAVKDPIEILTKASDMERQSAEFYNRAAQDCAARADAVTKQLFEALVQDEEGHYDEFDRQLNHIRRFGPTYLALQSFGKEVPVNGVK